LLSASCSLSDTTKQTVLTLREDEEIRDRERYMRTLEKSDTPILTGMQIYHNYVRPHEALNGKTPSDIAGVTVKGENKWLTLIQNASQGHKR